MRKYFKWGNLHLFLPTNTTDDYIDFTPKRFTFSIYNNLPIIDLEKSNFGDIILSKTLTEEGGILGVQLKTGGSYLINIIANEVINYEDKRSDLTVWCTLFPILVYNGYINLLSPNDFPRWNIPYNVELDSFTATITFPTNLTYTRQGHIVEKSIETENQQFFSLLWLSVKDMDGGSNDFFLLLMFYDEIPDLSKVWPLLMIFGIVAAIFIVILFIAKRKSIFRKNINS